MTNVSECCRFFEKHADNLKKVEFLVKEEKRFEWQAQAASQLSPSVVGSEEVCRQIQQPLYFNPTTKKLTPTAFNDAFDKGFSIDRVQYTTKEEIVQRGFQRDASYAAKNPDREKRTTVALVTLHTDKIRELRSSQNLQSLGVFDTALKNNISHADMCALVHGKIEKHRIREHLDSIHRLEMLEQTDQSISDRQTAE